MATTETRPLWHRYAIDLAQRLAAKDIADPSVFVVGVLGYAVENDDVGVDEFERSMCRHWLARLVDEQGNPLDDKLRDAWTIAAEENTLGHHGSLSSIVREDDRVTMQIVVSRRAATLPRHEVRASLAPHAETYVDHLLDALYEEAEPGGAT